MDRRVASGATVAVSIILLWAYATGRVSAVLRALQDPAATPVPPPAVSPGGGAPPIPGGGGSGTGAGGVPVLPPVPGAGGGMMGGIMSTGSVRTVTLRGVRGRADVTIRVDSRSSGCGGFVALAAAGAGYDPTEVARIVAMVCTP